IGDHAAAVFPIGTPHGEVRVDAARGEDFIVRSHGGGAEPHVPIEPGLERLLGEIARFARTAEAGLDARDFADAAIAHELAGDAEFARGALPRASLENALM